MLNLTQSRKVGRSIMSKNIYSKMSQIRERHPSVSEQCYHREPSLFFTSVSDSTRSQFTRGGGSCTEMSFLQGGAVAATCHSAADKMLTVT